MRTQPFDELLMRFLAAATSADRDQMSTCFADTAAAVIDGRTIVGRDEIAAALSTAPRRLERVADHVTSADHERAVGRWLVTEPTGAGSVDIMLITATAARHDHGWKLHDWSIDHLWSGARRARSPLDADSLVLCSGTIAPSVPFVAKAAAAATAGFDGISIYLREIEATVASGWSEGLLRAYLDTLGLAVAEVDGMLAWHSDPDDPDVPDLLDEQFRAAEAVGARSATLLLPPGEPVALDAFDPVVESLRSAADQAATRGLLVHLEPFAWSGLRSAALAAELCRRADRPNAGVMLDTWHLAAGPERGRLPVELTGEQVFGVQLCECADPDPPNVARAGMHERLPPGQGPAVTGSIVHELRTRGCTAPIGVEIYSDAVHALTPDDAAALAADSLRSVLGTRSTRSPQRPPNDRS